MIDLLEQEAAAKAERIAAEGVVLAQAAGWKAEPILKRAYGAKGSSSHALAEELEAPRCSSSARAVCTGPRAVLGSVSDQAAHTSPRADPRRPAPRADDRARGRGEGPILVGDDGWPGAERARETATSLFPGRRRRGVHRRGRPEPGRAVADGLVRQARTIGAAAIVVGSRGRSAAREIMLGSAAIAVLHHTDRPVTVVPGRRSRPVD